ncbi:hypothetical protein COW36_22210 [bacterium (Candidatus Blackallbacteria) CG17_big_fil_post_rev_8_21_14_2_50_48_46]|uniref:ABM domain-containing protein n=1 Tax=bacterium (Candidatus Blackallbacteria) CG17_big_fil_post_rev_8_21_14_2_50_48_46 TaxID=2014261 RepID=A0A2M7FYR2_9BACT|nr:MAG: hypothetical protein COW64_13640 [bacterium (Candidatus Blackallbacteria) CG18_big_fil_WC_8_21_14_2_50_49_26]PIW14329.1 MAG: hypothetical protein COW36_22210 [bacterium (Candidatus Blackallbacteria) CG17_big_fil_post_rev_8_21_14_2_50_48_46]PIW45598.1 MAG: hypothetical protein COW20_19815 [bacterium (Candidatus Blackallbacteria) CG13_big_fil_rev_8_21_14_2_50_49_14]
MAIFSAMFPILPGKTDRVREIAQGLSGEHATAFDQSQKSLGVPVESWHIQQTPMGDFLLVYLESEDALKMFQNFASAQGPSDVFLKAGILECTGVDLNQAMPGLPSQPVLDYRA